MYDLSTMYSENKLDTVPLTLRKISVKLINEL